ncbi:hypothetical protein AB0K11_23210 [Mycobacterium sp. NPDC050551]|uniref:hypothetical protein n=1 Tax=Mycobacterium sp. NPDC050551 TaxID=3155407 RepID=UPI0034352C44
MSSNDALATLLDRLDAADRSLAALPLSEMTPRELEEVFSRLDRSIALADELQQRLLGRLIATGNPVRMGGATWAEVLARRLRISPGEAQRRVARAVHAA